MLLPKEKLRVYITDDNYWFETRTGSDPETSRNAYFEENPSELIEGCYCAIGNDNTGYQLEQYLDQNWITVNPNSNYNLTITNAGLKALADAQNGGYRLYISGLKINDEVVTVPITEIINWTDNNFINYGVNGIVFSASATTTANASNIYNPSFVKQGKLNELLTWDFNSSNGGLQYTLTIPPDMADDNGNEEWSVGSIGLYVRVQNSETQFENSYTNSSGVDILFGIATLQSPVKKYASTVNRFGNKLVFYFNVILNNLGFVTNLEILPQETCKIPEIANESIIENISPSNDLDPRNLYLVANSHSTNIPALALSRGKNIDGEPIWSYVYPNDTFITVSLDDFASDVTNYKFVSWDSTTQKYVLANGSTASLTPNTTMPIGIRIGNSVVFSGDVINKDSNSYKYNVTLSDGGNNYEIDDQLLLSYNSIDVNNVILKLQVVSTNNGEIATFKLLSPGVGNVEINSTIAALYSPYSRYPQYGQDAAFKITSTRIQNYAWNFLTTDINKPIYCGSNGEPTTTVTDSFVGWCIGPNSIRLALDLRNEASFVKYGTTRYATTEEVATATGIEGTESITSKVTSLTPYTAKANYLQITKSNSITPDVNHTGDTLENPIKVNTFTKFNEVIIGKGVNEPYTDVNNPYITDASISFYGRAFRAWYQDIAEFYEADEIYEPGTLITMGAGEKEITLAINECNGIISEKPGYQLGTKKNDHYLPVALVGRVKVKMDGNSFVHFGDKIYLSKIKHGFASTIENGKCLGKIISHCEPNARLVECIVRIEF